MVEVPRRDEARKPKFGSAGDPALGLSTQRALFPFDRERAGVPRGARLPLVRVNVSAGRLFCSAWKLPGKYAAALWLLRIIATRGPVLAEVERVGPKR